MRCGRCRWVSVLVVPILLAACAAVPAVTAPGLGPPATGRSPALLRPQPSGAPNPSALAAVPPAALPDCPSVDVVLTVEQLIALDPACTADHAVTVRGWWDLRRSADGPAAAAFTGVLRDALPTGAWEEGLTYGPAMPFDQADADTAIVSQIGGWIEARVRLRQGDGHCSWVSPDDDQTNPTPPTWTCPQYALARSIKRVVAPATALEACPSTDRRMPVDIFVRYPAACFGGSTVKLTGWYDVNYIIGGWEDYWSIKPGWLWSMGIGPVPVLSPWSDPSEPDALRLHVRPGTQPAEAAMNRWVVLRGHYARRDEFSRCHFVYVDEWGGAPPPRMDDALARRDCARSFIVESVRAGELG